MLQLTFVGLILSCITAIGAKSLSEFSRHRLQELCQRWSAEKRLGVIKKNYERAALAASMFQCLFLCVTLILALYWGINHSEHLSPPWLWHEWAAMIAGSAIILIAVTVWIPSTFSVLWATPIVYYFWPMWAFLTFCAIPLEMFAWFCDAVFFRLAGHQPDTSEEEQFSEEIRTIVTDGHREGLLEDEARGMIEGVMELSDVVVSEIMTPRTDICSMPKTLTWDEMLRFVIKAPHSRIPVYDVTRDDIIGVIIAKDLLQELAKPTHEDRVEWISLLREPHFVPETKPVASLLREFQINHTHMVIVLDEYGGVSGVTTLEDIIEEIVGEIVDEFDPDVVDGIVQIGEGIYHIQGRVHIDEVNDRLKTDLPDDEDYDTLAGFLLDHFEHVPVQGEFLDHEKVRITVIEATRRRIETVRIEPIPEEE